MRKIKIRPWKDESITYFEHDDDGRERDGAMIQPTNKEDGFFGTLHEAEKDGEL